MIVGQQYRHKKSGRLVRIEKIIVNEFDGSDSHFLIATWLRNGIPGHTHMVRIQRFKSILDDFEVIHDDK